MNSQTQELEPIVSRRGFIGFSLVSPWAARWSGAPVAVIPAEMVDDWPSGHGSIGYDMMTPKVNREAFRLIDDVAEIMDRRSGLSALLRRSV